MKLYVPLVMAICTTLTLAGSARAEETPGQLQVEEYTDGQGGHPWRTSWLTVEGAKTYCVRVDPAPGNDTGLTLVMLHGAAFSVKTWLELGTIEFMAQHGVPTVAVDLPGFGMSPGRKGGHGTAPSKEAWLSALLQLVAPRRRIILVSPSMSGSFAVPYLERYGTLDGLAAWVPVAPVFSHKRGWALPADTRESVEVLAIYGEYDTKKLPDADVITAAFKVSHKVVIKRGRHPCYLDNPALFHRELLSLVQRQMVAHTRLGREGGGMTGLLDKISGKRHT